MRVINSLMIKRLFGSIVFLSLFPGSLYALQASYTFDGLNRLTSATYGDSTIEYQYDSNGNMTRVVTPTGCTNIVYLDLDGDGFGDPGESLQTCDSASGYVADNTDCDDTDTAAYPGQTWYRDVDGDGYYHGVINVTSCLRPEGYFTEAELTTIATTDNAPEIPNPDQADYDGDGIGDVADAFPFDSYYGDDSDGDGIADEWEYSNFGNLTAVDETTDFDNDTLTDLQEFAIDTNPTVSISERWDANGDGVIGLEEAIHALRVTSGIVAE